MSTFSEESRLLIANWEAVTDILQAHKRLQLELIGIVRALEPQLAREDWWARGWGITYQEQGATLTNSRWRRGGSDTIWVYVTAFTPDAVFGEAPPPFMYVWVAGKRMQLVRDLIDQIRERRGEGGVIGDLDERPNTQIVVRQMLPACVPEQLDTYVAEAGGQILTFLSHYGKLLDELAPMIEGHLSTEKDA